MPADGPQIAVGAYFYPWHLSTGQQSDEVVAINTRTGAQRIWRGGSLAVGYNVFRVASLSWAGGLRELAVLGQWCVGLNPGLGGEGCPRGAPGAAPGHQPGRPGRRQRAGRPAAAAAGTRDLPRAGTGQPGRLSHHGHGAARQDRRQPADQRELPGEPVRGAGVGGDQGNGSA